jgi:hypothetical protein
VEFPATQAYYKRTSTPLTYVFAIDVTQTAVFSGVTTASIVATRENIRRLYERFVTSVFREDGDAVACDVRVGIVTFNSRIQFFSVNGKQS